MREWLLASLVSAGAFLAGQEVLHTLLEFGEPEAAARWQAVNDGVMGGVSKGRFRITESATLEFSGSLSLENNGGFASVRTRPGKLPIESGDTLVLRVHGDGRVYLVNLYTTDRRVAFSYRAELSTDATGWQEIRLPLASFEPTSFGRTVAGMGPVDPARINGLGLMLSDKKPGPFRLEVGWVKILRGGD